MGRIRRDQSQIRLLSRRGPGFGAVGAVNSNLTAHSKKPNTVNNNSSAMYENYQVEQKAMKQGTAQLS